MSWLRRLLCLMFNQCEEPRQSEELEQRIMHVEREVGRLTVERLYGVDRER